MMNYIIPWPILHGIFILNAAPYIYLLLTIKKDTYFRIAQIPGLSPNWMSVWRVPIVFIGFISYVCADVSTPEQAQTLGGAIPQMLFGLNLIYQGLMMDGFDGKEARALILKLVDTAILPHEVWPDPSRKWAWFRHKEVIKKKVVIKLYKVPLDPWVINHTRANTIMPMFQVVEITDETADRAPEEKVGERRLILTEIGSSLDPFLDKATLIPIFGHIAFHGWMSIAVYWLMVGSEVASTLMRQPFVSFPGFRWLKKVVVANDSSLLGKSKFIWQIATLNVSIPIVSNWLDPKQAEYSWWIMSTLLFLAFLGGLSSNFSRLAIMKRTFMRLGIWDGYCRLQDAYKRKIDRNQTKRAQRREARRLRKAAKRAAQTSPQT